MQAQYLKTGIALIAAITLGIALYFNTGVSASDRVWLGQASDANSSVDLIFDLEQYDDPDYGFSMAVPVGWSRIVADDSVALADEMAGQLEPGYAVGFESPRNSLQDQFADYILIELLPGTETGLFESSEEHHRVLNIGSNKLSYDRLYIDSATDEKIDIDLVIYQRGVSALGYPLGLYAIGEPANEQALFEAFQIMLHTYTQTQNPFVVI